MKALLAASVRKECDKLVSRHHEYLYELDKEVNRITRRTGAAPAKVVHTPPHWNVHPNFNPFKVRLPRNASVFIHALVRKLRAEEYRPQTALLRKVPKADGSLRDVCIFQIPDAVVSRITYKSLLYKNAHRFSAYTYAYREDIGAHEAVANIYQDWQGRERIYIAEFDFTKFFDNIDHSFLWGTISRGGFLMTQQEEHVVRAFLSSRALDASVYAPDAGIFRDKGIPQGTSISLFLANVACWELDRSFERLGVGFARYADDTLVWSESYEKVIEAYETLRRFSTMVGAPINYKKSDGIHILSKDARGEISSKTAVSFLGYAIGLSGICISEKHVAKVKRTIARLINSNLLKLPKSGTYNPMQLGLVDVDYLVAISQIRRYLYGGLSDSALLSYVRGATPHLNFRGLMSYYPMVNDEKQLRDLDAWLVHCLKGAMRKRERLIALAGGPATLAGPGPNWITNLQNLKSVTLGTKTYDFRVPSFQLIHKVLRVAIQRGGARAFSATATYYS